VFYALRFAVVFGTFVPKPPARLGAAAAAANISSLQRKLGLMKSRLRRLHIFSGASSSVVTRREDATYVANRYEHDKITIYIERCFHEYLNDEW
jgi:hypothetical protein